MKHALKAAALLALFVGSSHLPAAETYGPVLKIKPKGYSAEATESAPKPGTPGNVKNGQGNQPAGLLLPAVQKVRASAGRSQGAQPQQNEGIGGGLDRDIIRQIPSGKPKPTK